jgi:hypothetical protein
VKEAIRGRILITFCDCMVISLLKRVADIDYMFKRALPEAGARIWLAEVWCEAWGAGAL